MILRFIIFHIYFNFISLDSCVSLLSMILNYILTLLHLDKNIKTLHNQSLLRFLKVFSEILCHGPELSCSETFRLSPSLCLKYKERERHRGSLCSGARLRPGLDNRQHNTDSWSPSEKFRSSDNHHGGQGLSSQDGESIL